MTEAPDSTNKPEAKALFDGIVRPLAEKDLEALKPILETWIKDRDTGELLSDEVEEDLQIMRESIAGESDKVYLVAESKEGEVVGVIGLRDPDKRMIPFTKTSKPAELVNAYVANEHRAGKGVGSAMVKAIEEEAKRRGYTEVVFNSGPRYKDTGWGFHKKLYGEPVAVAEKYYGEGGDAPVWRKEL